MAKDVNGLSGRDLEVLRNYFGVSRFNKTDALRRGGYKNPNAVMSKFFARPVIKREVERYHEMVSKRFAVDHERVLEEMAKIAFFNPVSVLEPDPDHPGWFKVDFSKTDVHDMAALAEIEVREEWEGKGDDAVKVQRIKFKPWNKLDALNSIMKHAGLSKDKSSQALGDIASALTEARNRAQPRQRHHDDRKPVIDG